MHNRLILDVLAGKAVERPPVWLMRQAGRILPQYRAIRKEIRSFKHLVKNPALAAQVTIQPVDELGVDAAIIFSDILVIPEAMGLDYELVEKVGPIFPQTISSRADVERLSAGEDAAANLEYVYEAIRRTKEGLQDRVPLIGFCGAPWTIFTYMIEGKGTKAFTEARKFLMAENQTAMMLMEKITSASIAYLQGQIAAGADLVQVFDSWAGVLSADQYTRFVVPFLRRICEEVTDVPVILFSKGAWHSLATLQEECRPRCIGLDWCTDGGWARGQLGSGQVVQGNFDPAYLYAEEAVIIEETHSMLRKIGPRHIVNLGHGVYPDTPLDHVKCFVRTAQDWRY